MAKNYLFVHGFKGNPNIPKWFLWASNQLRTEHNAITSVPQMPYPDAPLLEPWITVILRAIPEQYFPESGFIGHSLGGAGILRALERSAFPAEHVVLIGTPFDDLGREVLHPFYETPWDFKLLKSQAKRFTCMYSKDDPAVPFDHGEKFAKALGAELITFDGVGHFETLPEFPELIYNLLLKN